MLPFFAANHETTTSENILLGNWEGPASAQPSCHFSSGPVSEFDRFEQTIWELHFQEIH
jgi:hypothetical protein